MQYETSDSFPHVDASPPNVLDRPSRIADASRETWRALPFLLLLSMIVALSVNLILVLEKKLVAEHLNDSRPASVPIIGAGR